MAGGIYLASMVGGRRRYELKKLHSATSRACRWPSCKPHVISCTCHCSCLGCAASIPLQVLHKKLCAEGAATIDGRSSCAEAHRRPSITLRQRACLSATRVSNSKSGFVGRGAGGILYLFPYQTTENNRRDCEQASSGSGWVLPRGRAARVVPRAPERSGAAYNLS